MRLVLIRIGQRLIDRVYKSMVLITNAYNYLLPAPNAKMTAFQSLFQHINLKTLTSTLKIAQLQAPLPFYVLRVGNLKPCFPEHSSLSISRQISNQTLNQYNGPLSAWSLQHLKRIQETRRSSDRIILKNPYKSFQLLSQSLELGVNEMVIDSLEEFYKIQSFLKNSPKFKNKKLKYHWLNAEIPENIHELIQVRQNIEGIYFDLDQSQSIPNVEKITRNILSCGVNLKYIFCEGKTGQLDSLIEWQKEELEARGKKITKTIDICEYSEVENYILATKTLCKKRSIIREEARELIGKLECSEKSLLVDHQNQQWLLSAVSTLPLDQERFMFDLETLDEEAMSAHPKAFVL